MHVRPMIDFQFVKDLLSSYQRMVLSKQDSSELLTLGW